MDGWDGPLREVMVGASVTKLLSDQYSEYDYYDMGEGLWGHSIFLVPDNEDGDRFIRMVEKLEKADEWKSRPPRPKTPNRKSPLVLPGQTGLPRQTRVFMRTDECPVCFITLAQYGQQGCGIANLPASLCPGTKLPKRE